MDLTEQVNRLRTRADALKEKQSAPSWEMLDGILSVLDVMAQEMQSLGEDADALAESVSDISEGIVELAEMLESLDDEEDLYEATCPECGEVFYFDASALEEDVISCPECGYTLEFMLDAPDAEPDDSPD